MTKSELDLVELMLHGLFTLPPELQGFVRQPKRMTDAEGRPLSFSSTVDLIRGTFYYANARRRSDLQAASNFLEGVERSLNIEKISLNFVKLVYERLAIALPDRAGAAPRNLIFQLYSEYADRSVAEIEKLVENALEQTRAAWRTQCGNESALTPDRLKHFYETLEFPTSCYFRKITNDPLRVAQFALPLICAQRIGAKTVFDFGGNSGLMTTALGAAGVERCLLVEFSKPLLDWARWRDRRMGLTNIEYLEVDHACQVPDELEGSFDFGVCTEVLEHVFDVKAAVAGIAKLLKKGGTLFQSASFGHYPYPTHLRRNVVFAGKEDALMSNFGLQRVRATFPVPSRGNERVYRKVT